MPKPTQTTTFRFDEATLNLIDEDARARSLSKTELLRTAVELLHDTLTIANADAHTTLEEIRVRHPGAENLTVNVSIGRDSMPETTVLLDGDGVDDIVALSAVIDRKAYVFLVLSTGAASFATAVGDDGLLIRPQFAIADPMPWPPKESYRIVLPLKTPALDKRASTRTKAEA